MIDSDTTGNSRRGWRLCALEAHLSRSALDESEAVEEPSAVQRNRQAKSDRMIKKENACR